MSIHRIIILYLVSVFLPTVCQVSAQEKPMLSVSGTISFEGKEQSGVIVTIYHNNTKYAQDLSKRHGRFDFSLDYNNEYIIEVSKEGFINKRILLDTQIPKSVLNSGGVSEGFYDLNIPMIRNYPGLDKSLFNKPVTRFYFNQSDWLFIKDEAYYNKIAKELLPVLNQLDNLKKDAIRQEQLKADSLMAVNNQEEAYMAIQRALEYNPSNKESQQQSKQIQKALKQQKNIDSKVRSYLQEGDELLKRNYLIDALHQYKKANALQPDNELISQKIYAVDSIRSAIQYQSRQSYDSLMDLADQKVAQEEYTQAINLYLKAWDLFPDEELPHQKIEDAEIAKKKSALAKNEEANMEESAAIESYKLKGESYLASNNLTGARLLFQEANQKYPNESYFKAQLRKIKTLEDKEFKLAQEEDEDAISNRIISLTNTADSLFEESLWAEAKLYYLQAEQLDPGNRKLLNKIEKANENYILAQANILDKQSQPDTILTLSGLERQLKIKEYKTQLEKEKQEGNKQQMGELYGKIASSYHLENNLSEALTYYEEALEIKKEANDQQGATTVLNEMATVYYDSGRYENAIEKYYEAIEIQKVNGNREVEAMMLDNIGQVYENTYNYDKAVNYYQQSLEIADSLNSDEQQSTLLAKIADVNIEQNDLQLAAENYEKKLKIDQKLEKQEEISSTLNNLGSAFYGMRKYDDALEYYQQSLESTSKLGDKKQMSIALNNIGNVNYDKKKYRTAVNFYSRSIKLKKEIGYDRGLAISLHNLGNSYMMMDEQDNATKYFSQSLELANKMKYQDISSKNYLALAKAYSETNNFRKAYEYQKLYEETREVVTASAVQISESTKDLNWVDQSKMIKTLQNRLVKQRLLSQYQSEQKQKQIEIKNLELQNQAERIKKQRILNLLGVSGSGALIIILLLIYRQYRIKKRNNQKLRNKNELISFQKQQITDSIEYASRIQKAVMPPEEYMVSILPDHFILNKPRDIVSGDYYWTTQRGHESIIAVADCTGHGVPGAFMSMLGISFLNEIVNKKSSANSHEILNELRQYVIRSLHQTREENNVLDGMDIALCIIDTAQMKLQFSGAHNPLFLIRNNELIEFKANKMPIGIGFFDLDKKSFTSEEVPLKTGDMIYIFSDGYADQFGGSNRKKYGIRRFKELLLEIHQLSSEEQINSLDKAITEWRGEQGQIDDMMVMGVRI